MKAFISYSVEDSEEYIVTLLSNQLRQHGFALIMSSNTNYSVDITTRNQIFVSQLFIGLVTSTGLQWRRVLDEYNIAVSNNIPAILIIEDNVRVEADFRGNYVYFNRNNPHDAIIEINRRMVTPLRDNNNAAGWILGGAAILTLLALLAGNKNDR